jgi:hypothetical protein
LRQDLWFNIMPTPITLTQFRWWYARNLLWVLELYQAHAVVGRVDEPDIGNTVLGLESSNGNELNAKPTTNSVA